MTTPRPYPPSPRSLEPSVDCFKPWLNCRNRLMGSVPLSSFRAGVGTSVANWLSGARFVQKRMNNDGIPKASRSKEAESNGEQICHGAGGQQQQCRRWRNMGSVREKKIDPRHLQGRASSSGGVEGELRARRHRFPSLPRSRGPRRTRRCPRSLRGRRYRSR